MIYPMADLFRNCCFSLSASIKKTTGFETVRLLLLSVGFISTILLIKVTMIPYYFNVLLSALAFRSWLSPPYVYILVNFIIVTIAASSAFHRQTHHPAVDIAADTSKITDATPISFKQSAPYMEDEYFVATKDSPHESVEKDENFTAVSSVDEESSCLTETEKGTRETENETRGETEAETETMEETWKAITEGRGKGAGRQLKKSESEAWRTEVGGGGRGRGRGRREMRKWETFSTLRETSATAGLRRERLPSEEDLKRRVEAFINKMNNDIRLQRQESDQRYLDMVNRSL
ncbi:hypothetical protein L1049_028296 [Liquidambar formosana]|uniref:DUF4408 domain-containing protein n=1 Tax=Liquidambar formosana TaxID=63359 RepID=A0AAP0RKP3_LIQFO